jgi:Glycosyltransferase family 87
MVVRQRARFLVVAAVGGYFGLVAALGGYARWGRLGVSSSNVWFGDLRSVTSAWECARRGIAVVPANPCDPFGRPANYPRLWVYPWHLGLGPGDTFALGLAIGGLFLAAAIVVVPEGESLLGGALYAFALCSPAVMLGVERGNVDLTLFALVVAAVLLAQRSVRGVVASGACMLLAAMLKLYPIFGIGFLLRRSARVAVLVLAGFAVYVVALHHQLRAAYDSYPQGDAFSYGIRRVSEWLSAQSGNSPYRAWDVVLVVAVAVPAVLLGRRAGAAGGALVPRELDLFLAGAGIYVCTYAVARNFDYRLVFVLLAIPQLVRWARAGSLLAVGTIAAALATMWLDEWSPFSTAAVPVVAQLLLFGGLTAWLARAAR